MEGDIESSEKLCILLSCWRDCCDAHTSGERGNPDCQSYFELR